MYWDDQLEQRIERAPHTITVANGTITKHLPFVTDNKMLFDRLAEITREPDCWTYIKPHTRSEMERQAAWPSRTIILGPTTLAT